MANGSNSLNDATAQTLNYALGNLGGGTRSWMLAASSNTTPALPERIGRPVPSVPSAQAATPTSGPRRRGRPRKNPQPEPPPNKAPVQTPIEPHIERQPSSTSASPHLANILTGQERRASVTVLPSPTPSLEHVTLPVSSDAGPASALDFFSFDPAQTDGAGGDDAASAIRDMRQKRISTDISAQAPKRPQLGRDGHMRSATTTSASANLQHASISRPQSTGPLRASSNQSPPNYSPHAEQMRQRHVPSSKSPLYAQRGPVDPRNLLAHSPTAAFFHMPVQNINHTNMSTMWYTAGECLQMLDAFERSRGAAGGLPQGDKGRLDVLRTAVFKEDWNYLMMHQIYCLHDVQPSALPPLILSQAALTDALQLLRAVLDDNRNLSNEMQIFFANFPHPMHTISTRWPYWFNELLTKFSSFLFCSSRFAVFKTTCLQRRYPPLVSELVGLLAVESPVLQRVMFTSVLRTIWQAVPGDHRIHYEQQAVKHFHDSQTEFSQRRMRSAEQRSNNTGQATSDSGWDNHWRTLLTQVIAACETRQVGQSNIAPNQPSLLQYQQRQSQQRQQQQVHQSSVLLQQNVLSRENPMTLPSKPPAQLYQNQPRHTGRTRLPPVPPSHQLQSQSRPKTTLLPAPRVQLPQQRQPNPTRFSLHQAHLRSPVPKARSIDSKLYQYVEGFLKSPARLSTANRAVEKWSFNLSADMMQTIAPTVPAALGHAGHRLVDKDSKTLRLRCIKWTASNRPEDHIWATTDTSWIPYSCFKLNGALLEQRKKVHHGKDLPIDITKHVKEGENVLEIMVTSDSRDKAFLDYLVAIEFLGITCEETLKRNCLGEQFRSSEDVMAKLKTKLSSGSGEDDELAIVGGTQTINLFDPFSASSMCELPVRSRVCLHNDCFDLEIFLSTRRRKGDVSDPDVWRCPICNADARPKYLIADGFLVEVKKVLEAKGQARTRAIVVHPDGSWEPKEEVRDPNGVSDDSPTSTARRASVAAEIIDISD